MKNLLLFFLLLRCVITNGQGASNDEPRGLFDKRENKIDKYTLDTIPVFHTDSQRQLCYEDVVNADGVDKDRLYNAAKKWCVTRFYNSNNAIKSDDKESGIIITKGSQSKVVGKPNSSPMVSFGRKADYAFTLTIECKDNRYKYKINDIYVNGSSAESYINTIAHKKKLKPLDYAVMNDLHSTFMDLGEDIKKQISKNTQTENW